MLKYRNIAISSLFTFLGISGLAELAHLTKQPLLIAPFGASFLILSAMPESPFARPRNIVLGYLLSALVGLLVLETIGSGVLALGFAVALAVFVMDVTKTVHPPAGAVPLLILLSKPGWKFLWTPILVSALILAGLSLLNRELFRRKLLYV